MCTPIESAGRNPHGWRKVGSVSYQPPAKNREFGFETVGKTGESSGIASVEKVLGRRGFETLTLSLTFRGLVGNKCQEPDRNLGEADFAPQRVDNLILGEESDYRRHFPLRLTAKGGVGTCEMRSRGETLVITSGCENPVRRLHHGSQRTPLGVHVESR